MKTAMEMLEEFICVNNYTEIDLINKVQELKLIEKDYTIRFSNWLDKNYIKKKGAYYHKGDWEFSNGENNKKKLLSIFNRNVE
jgi:hypothetical protein